MGTRSMNGDTTDLPTVIIVDDEAPLRRIVGGLLHMDGYQVADYGSGEELLKAAFPRGPACILLDVVMPGMTGLELQERLAERERCPPIVFMSGSSDIPEAVMAMKNGAEDFLKKPFKENDLRLKVRGAIEKSQERLKLLAGRRRVMDLFDKLSPREKEVAVLTAQGERILRIVCDLGISESTVKKHRISAYRKMEVENAVMLRESLAVIEKI